jgi:hypothetical protein
VTILGLVCVCVCVCRLYTEAKLGRFPTVWISNSSSRMKSRRLKHLPAPDDDDEDPSGQRVRFSIEFHKVLPSEWEAGLLPAAETLPEGARVRLLIAPQFINDLPYLIVWPYQVPSRLYKNWMQLSKKKSSTNIKQTPFVHRITGNHHYIKC